MEVFLFRKNKIILDYNAVVMKHNSNIPIRRWNRWYCQRGQL